MPRLSNKTIIISGGATGIGRASAELFAIHGATVIICDRNEEEGNNTAAAISQNGHSCIFFKLDITSEDQVKKIVFKIHQLYKKIDGLFNNAGIDLIAPIMETKAEDWDKVMAVNLKGAFLMAKHVVPIMKARNGGVILNTSSIGGLAGWANYSAYCASKGGLIALTKQMAVELADYKIRVNCICPGSTLTPMVERILSKENDPEAARKAIASLHPLGRFAQPIEIAYAALFCMSADSSFCTGMILPVDGGITAV